MTQEQRRTLLIEAAAFLMLAVASFTFCREQYLFGWLAHNWKFYALLVAAPLLLAAFGKLTASAYTAVGIVGGAVVGNCAGDYFQQLTISQITPDLAPELVYRLHHHPGFEIWLGIIVFLAVTGIALEFLRAKGRSPAAVLRIALGAAVGASLGGAVLPRVLHPERYNLTYPPVVLYAAFHLLVAYVIAVPIVIVLEGRRSS